MLYIISYFASREESTPIGPELSRSNKLSSNAIFVARATEAHIAFRSSAVPTTKPNSNSSRNITPTQMSVVWRLMLDVPSGARTTQMNTQIVGGFISFLEKIRECTGLRVRKTICGRNQWLACIAGCMQAISSGPFPWQPSSGIQAVSRQANLPRTAGPLLRKF